jgi:hypothetical protein
MADVSYNDIGTFLRENVLFVSLVCEAHGRAPAAWAAMMSVTASPTNAHLDEGTPINLTACRTKYEVGLSISGFMSSLLIQGPRSL